MSMQLEPIRVTCPACGNKMDIPPRTSYAACKKCGSEYMMQYRGGAYTLQALTPEEFELNREMAASEKEGELGCANTALSMIAIIVVLFCIGGGVGRFLFDNVLVCLVAWVIAMILLIPVAIVLKRNLETSQRRKDRIKRRLEAATPVEEDTSPAEGNSDQAEGEAPTTPL